MELRDLIGPARSADSAVRGRWRCRLYHSGRAYFATVATADYHGTVAIVMWITLELCALTMLHSSGALGATAAIVLAIILLILLIADMACYLAYCHLPPMPAFIDGTAPLIAVTVFSEIVVAMIV